MDVKQQRKMLRRAFSVAGWALVVYYIVMNVAVAGIMMLQESLIIMREGMSFDMEQLQETLMGNGWGYILSCVCGMVILLGWKGTAYFSREICKRGKPMTGGKFTKILCIFLSCQAVFQLAVVVLELILNSFGVSLMETLEKASVSADTVSMFLYMGVFAPVAEEILFRGLVLRTLEPYGKKFAIVMSAFLFGIFHGNVVQAPFAFVTGLVLGYVAVEYNVSWAMLLHMINNLVLADMMGRITQPLGDIGSTVVFWAIMLVFSVAAIVILIINRREIRSYSRQNRMHPLCVNAFFTNGGVITMTVLMAINMILFFFI